MLIADVLPNYYKEDSVTSVKYLLEVLAKANIPQVVDLLSNSKVQLTSNWITHYESNTDFSQSLLQVAGTKAKLNPVISSVCEAFPK